MAEERAVDIKVCYICINEFDLVPQYHSIDFLHHVPSSCLTPNIEPSMNNSSYTDGRCLSKLTFCLSNGRPVSHCSLTIHPFNHIRIYSIIQRAWAAYWIFSFIFEVTILFLIYSMTWAPGNGSTRPSDFWLSRCKHLPPYLTLHLAVQWEAEINIMCVIILVTWDPHYCHCFKGVKNDSCISNQFTLWPRSMRKNYFICRRCSQDLLSHWRSTSFSWKFYWSNHHSRSWSSANSAW